MIFNDLDISNWKQLDVDVNSLWIIPERDKSGKHSNFYHGNFIPQIPNQLIRRFTKKDDIVLDPFLGSGTTLYECEKLGRKCIGFDINTDILNFVKRQMTESNMTNFVIDECDVTNKEMFDNKLNTSLNQLKSKSIQFVILHPPYMDIIKFTEKEEDLSNINEFKIFLNRFNIAVFNSINQLDKNRYFAIVIGDIYKNSEVVPMSFYIINIIKKSFQVKLKGIVIKNIEGNRGKIGKHDIWQYRALKSDYFIFKHEYILIFKKEF